MPIILTYLGRVWLQRGREEKSITSLRHALDFSNRALEMTHGNVYSMFNVAFVKFQIAEIIRSTAENRRSLNELNAAVEDLKKAIEMMSEIANAKNPPYPKNDILQRITMGRNTLMKQLDRAIQSQKEYEESSYAKLEAAKRRREEEEKRKAEIAAQAREAYDKEQQRLADQRRQIEEEERQWRERKDVE